ncbi:TPA: ABC transporter transmembrane domain-containing protein, partial [Clostridioides difficile]
MIKELKNDFFLFFKSIRALKFNKIKLLIIFIIMVISNILSLVNPLLFGKIINGIINKSIYDVKLNMILMCLIFFISIALNYINNKMVIKISTNLEMELKESIFNSILKTKYSDFSKVDKGKFINNIENDSSVFSNLLSNNISILINSISMVISFCIMLYISPTLTLVLILTLPLIGLIYMISGSKIKSKELEYRDIYDYFFSFLNETIYGLKFLKLFNAEKGRINIFKNLINHIYSIQIKKFDIQQISEIIVNIVSFIANMLSLIIGIYLIFQGKLSLGMLTAFNNYSEIFKNSSLSFAEFNSIMQEMSVSLTRINEVLEYKKHDKSKSNLYQELDHSIQRIQIKNLSYSTLDNVGILKNVNIEF